MSLSEEMTFDPRKSLVRVVVSLFDKPQFLTLRLVETRLHAVRLLETLQSKDQEFCVVFVGEWREGNWGESPAFQPVNCRAECYLNVI